MNPTDTITDKRGRVACPASFEHADLLTNYKLHFASPSQIAKYGVCRKCRARMKKHNAAILAGKVETPVDLNERHHEPDLEHDHAASVAPGEFVQTTDFPYDAICETERELDEALGLVAKATPDARREAADVLHQVFQWCFPRNGKTDLRTAAARLAVFVSGLNPRVLDGKTLEEMATELDRTKAALSKTNVHAERHFGIHFTRSRSDTSRAHMAAAQLGHKPTNTKKRTSNQTVTNEPAEGGGQAEGGAA
jgi:hypothetical protein